MRTTNLRPTVPGLAASPGDEALAELLRLLKQINYSFISPTPATHERVVARTDRRTAQNLRDVLGWNLPFEAQMLPAPIRHCLEKADGLAATPEGRFKSRFRVSSLGEDLYLHSSFPTDAPDAVFFGPDSYRFAEFVRTELVRCPAPAGAHLVDIGTGAGVGAIVAAKTCPGLVITMSDVNAKALRLARINASVAAVPAKFARGRYLDAVSGSIDIAVANPPYLVDDAERDYRHGGDMLGARVAYEMARAALARLRSGGRMLLYTGSAIVDGRDPLQEALVPLVRTEADDLDYREVDPDVFGEELARLAYRQVERIALVTAVITRR